MIKLLTVLLLGLQADRPTPIPIGTAAPDFTLPGVDGKEHSLKEYADAKLLLIIFNTNHCPTAQKYEERIKKVQADYGDRGLKLVVINPNDAKAVRPDELGYTDLADSLAEMKIRAKHRHFEFPYLYDGETQAVSKAYGPLVTPHAFLFDATRHLRYQGRIDDNEYEEEGLKAHELRDAIDALLSGAEVKTPTTRPHGCSVKWSYKRPAVQAWLDKAAAEKVTLTRIDASNWSDLVKTPGEKVRLVHYWTGSGKHLDEMVMMNWMYRRRNFELILVTHGPADVEKTALARLEKAHASATNLVLDGAPAVPAEVFGKGTPESATFVLSPDGKVLYSSSEDPDVLTVRRTIVANLRDDRLPRFRRRSKK